MDPITQQENHRKALALIVCLFISFMYWESVWKPYFDPASLQRPTSTAETTAKTEPTPKAEIVQGQEFVERSPLESATTISPADEQAAPAAVEGVATTVPRSYPSDGRIAAQGLIQVETPALTINLSLLGGRFKEVLLNNYAAQAEEGSPGLNLVQHTEYAPLPMGVYSGGVDDAWVEYTVSENAQVLLENQRLLVGSSGPSVLSLEGTLPDGRGIVKSFTFHPAGHVVDVSVNVSAPAVDAGRINLEWTHFSDVNESSWLDPYNVTGFTWFDGEKALREAYASFEAERRELGNIRWVAQSDKYFMATLLSPTEAVPGYIVRTGTLWRSRLSGGSTQAEMQLVLGPKEYEGLQKLGHELQRVIDFGYTGFIAAPLLTLLHVAYSLVGNYGLAIVILTILVRIALYPLAAASFKQMRAMQDLKPDIDRIREQVADKQQQQVELMALYKKRGVNPLGGCLPLLLQMPIFIGLYSALMLSVELRHAPFAGWIQDLSAPEALIIGGIGIPVMVILFVISMMVQQWTTPTTMDPAQKKVMMVMPIVFGFLFAKFPAGLTLYWLTSNLISIGQQKAMYKTDRGRFSALYVTLAVSAAVFAFAFVITRF